MNAPRQSLARKWRPQSFAELCGHDYAVRAIQNAVHRHHAFLFTGTRGVGKTTLARIIAKTLNCLNCTDGEPCLKCDMCLQIADGSLLDVVELDAASHTQVDKMRELLESARHSPMHSQYKVFIIDEAHMLSKAAFASMLKTLEEPPDYLKFVLATTDPQRMPATILSRCLCFHLRPLERAQIGERLKFILQAEKYEYEEAAVREVSRQARGSMRDALSIAEQAIAHSDGKLQSTAVHRLSGEADAECIATILSAVAAADHAALSALAKQLEADGAGFDSVLSRLAAFLYKTALTKLAPNAAEDDDEKQAIANISKLFDDETLQVLYEIAVRGRKQLPWAPDEQIGFEMTLLRMTLFSPVGGNASPVGTAAGRNNAESPPSSPPKNAAPNNASAPAKKVTHTKAPQTASPPPALDAADVTSVKDVENAKDIKDIANAEDVTSVEDVSTTPFFPTSPSDWKKAVSQLTDAAKALADYCTLKEITNSEVLLVIDKSATDIRKLLPELKKELQRIFHENFAVSIIEGEDDSATIERAEELKRAAKERPFIREILEVMPEANFVDGSIHLENTSGEKS